MAIKTLNIQKDGVVSINTALGIPVGTEMDLVNESIFHDVYLQESDTAPPANKVDKRSLTQRDFPGSEAYIPANSGEIWVYSPNGYVTISVQEL